MSRRSRVAFAGVFAAGLVLLAPAAAAAAPWIVCVQDVGRWVCGQADLDSRPTRGTFSCPAEQFPDAASGMCIGVDCGCGPITGPPSCEIGCACNGIAMPSVGVDDDYYYWPCLVAVTDAAVALDAGRRDTGVRDAGRRDADIADARPPQPDSGRTPDGGGTDTSTPRPDGSPGWDAAPANDVASFRGSGGCTCETTEMSDWGLGAGWPILWALTLIGRRRRC